MKPEKLYKYPRTLHFPWSQGLTNDDRVIKSLDPFIGKEVVATLKMDGENSNFYNDYIHARSLDKDYHESRTWVNELHGEIGYMLKPGERICGENVAAVHSIRYKNLDSFFYVFSYWIEDECQSWDDTVKRCDELGLITVPVLYRGIWDEEIIKGLANTHYKGNEMEGYVVRITDKFTEDFSLGTERWFKGLAKYVRKSHVQTDEHWKTKPVEWNNWKS